MDKQNKIKTPEEWAIQEYATDPYFWQRCQRESGGLMKALVDFVINTAQSKATSQS